MTTKTFFPKMHGVADINAAATTDASKKRLANIRAAAENPAKKAAFNGAVMGLKRLGLDLEKIAASADVAAIDKAMADMRWSVDQRFTLKSNLASIGAVDPDPAAVFLERVTSGSDGVCRFLGNFRHMPRLLLHVAQDVG